MFIIQRFKAEQKGSSQCDKINSTNIFKTCLKIILSKKGKNQSKFQPKRTFDFKTNCCANSETSGYCLVLCKTVKP